MWHCFVSGFKSMLCFNCGTFKKFGHKPLLQVHDYPMSARMATKIPLRSPEWSTFTLIGLYICAPCVCFLKFPSLSLQVRGNEWLWYGNIYNGGRQRDEGWSLQTECGRAARGERSKHKAAGDGPTVSHRKFHMHTQNSSHIRSWVGLSLPPDTQIVIAPSEVGKHVFYRVVPFFRRYKTKTL